MSPQTLHESVEDCCLICKHRSKTIPMRGRLVYCTELKGWFRTNPTCDHCLTAKYPEMNKKREPVKKQPRIRVNAIGEKKSGVEVKE